jgi:glycosyltransferase involved in cell wall biosynthesis
VILGEGEERDKLETLIQELHLNDCVFLKGFVRNPYKYMARAKVFVLSSLWEDAGHVMLEAAYVKTPIVSTRCPSGQEEFLDYGEAGELCVVGDPKEMADCIHKVLQSTETGKVERAYNKSLNFTMERHGENLDRIIEGLTS